MLRCKKCKSLKIKTRTNKSFGKSKCIPVNCRDCGSTEIENFEARYNTRRKVRK